VLRDAARQTAECAQKPVKKASRGAVDSQRLIRVEQFLTRKRFCPDTAHKADAKPAETANDPIRW